MGAHDCHPAGGYSGWWLWPLLLVAAGLQIRICIMFHDCTHSSFFASQRANRLLGYVAGLINFTPFEDWRQPA